MNPSLERAVFLNVHSIIKALYFLTSSHSQPRPLLCVTVNPSILEIKCQGLPRELTQQLVVNMIQGLVLFVEPCSLSPSVNPVLASVAVHGVAQSIHHLLNIVQAQQVALHSLAPSTGSPEAFRVMNHPENVITVCAICMH